MPRNNDCNHRRCYSGLCRMLTPEEIEPDADDLALGKQLVAEGWQSISTKYRRVARWLRDPAALEAERSWDYARRWGLRAGNPTPTPTQSPSSDIETRELTIRQWRAFKKAGGSIC